MNPFESFSPRKYSELTKAGQLEAFVADADHTWDLADLHCREWLQHEPLAAGIGSDICHALIHASISSLASQLSPELLAESVRRDIWPLKQARFFCRHLPDLHHRVSALAELASLTADSGRARIVVIDEGANTMIENHLRSASSAASTFSRSSRRWDSSTKLSPPVR